MMRSFTEYIMLALWLAFIPLLSSCGGGDKAASTAGFTREIYTPRYASGFRILGNDSSESVLIEVKNPWEGAESVTRNLLVLPSVEELPEGYNGQVLRGKVSRIVAMSSTSVAMLDLLGVDSTLVGISGKRFISTPRVRARLENIAEVGYDGQMDYEALVASRPDLVLIYGVEGASSLESKLADLRIPYLYIGDYLEESPLGKAEWLVALSAVTTGIAAGERAFAPIPERYNALKDSIAALGVQPVKVMMNAPYADSWLLPPSGSYGAQLIADAGGIVLTGGKESTTVIPISREEGLLLAGEAEFWLNPGSASDMDGFRRLVPGFDGAGCVRRGNIYNNNKRSTPGGGNDYFESGVLHPEIVLADLAKILHPEHFSGELYYYRKLDDRR